MKRKKMTAYNEKRSYNRCSFKAPIQFSYFNQEYSEGAYTINHAKNGMCFKSKRRFKVGSTILIRTQNYGSNGSCACRFEGLPQLALGEIKWCREIQDPILSSYNYKAGVKYYAPHY
jgi:hypothetical protein